MPMEREEGFVPASESCEMIIDILLAKKGLSKDECNARGYCAQMYPVNQQNDHI